MYTDDTIMPNGQYKFRRLKEIPSDYFLTIWGNGGGSDKQLKEWIKKNLTRLKLTGKYSIEPLSKPISFICDKKTFPTKKDAIYSLRKIRSDKGDHKKPQRAYECPRCSGLHLTSKDYNDYIEEKERRSLKQQKAST